MTILDKLLPSDSCPSNQKSVYYKKPTFNLANPLTDCILHVDGVIYKGNLTGAWYTSEEMGEVLHEVYLGTNMGTRWVPSSMLEQVA